MVIIFQGMQDQNADSIKSLEGYDLAWVEEAQTLSKKRSRHAPTNTPNRQQRVLMESSEEDRRGG